MPDQKNSGTDGRGPKGNESLNPQGQWPVLFQANGPVPWGRVAVVLVVALAFLLHKKADSLINPQFWAEDGTVFFSQARELGLWSLAKPYNGAFYTFQRIVALAADRLPPRYAPLCYNYTSLLATLAVLVYVMRSRTDIGPKMLFALAVVFSPHNGEVFLNLTNIHWILAVGVLTFILSADPPPTTWRTIGYAVLFILLLSGPFVIFFWPLLALRAIRRRTTFSLLALAVASLCLCLELRVLETPANRLPGPFNIHDRSWIYIFGERISGLWLFGDAELVNQAHLGPMFFVAFTCMAALLLVGLSLYYRDYKSWRLLYVAFAVTAATVYSYRGRPAELCNLGDRYSYIPCVLMTWVVLRMMTWSSKLAAPSWVILTLVMLASTSMPAPKLPDLHWKQACKALGGPVPCSIPINPQGWSITYTPKGRAARAH